MAQYLCSLPPRPPVPFFSDVANAGPNKFSSRLNSASMSIVDDPILGASRKVINMTIHEADGGGGTSSARPRGQLATPNALGEGTEFWVGSGLLLPVGFPTPTTASGFNAFQQIMGTPATGYPPVQFGFYGNAGGFGWKREPAKGSVMALDIKPTYGKWMDVVMHVKMSFNAAVGFVGFYINTGSGYVQQDLAPSPGDTLVRNRLYTQTITDGAQVSPLRNDIQHYRSENMYNVSTCYHTDIRRIVATGNDTADLAAVNPGSYA